MGDDFYMFLPSNSSMDVYSENTTGHFIVKLPREVRLTDGAWECGLREIHYPHSWYNVAGPGQTWLSFGNDLIGQPMGPDHRFVPVPQRKNVKEGFYETPEDLVREIKRQIRTEPNKQKVDVQFDPVSSRVTVITDLPTHAWLILSPHLRTLLGFPHEPLKFGSHARKTTGEKIRVFQVVHNLFVYLSVLAPRVVGDSLVPLLNIVPLQGERGKMSYVEYANPTYAPVNTTTFNSLEVDIRDSSGVGVPFDGGVTTLLVHFRRRPS